ncbi:MAG: radical SAM protein [Nitrospirota bacterium]|nr:radical SAM protein [Nitrospirota bacterium]MDP3597801.1 radical SAM protein [Nitrospirota bacterium]
MPTPRLLLLIPPLTQLNTPYPSTAYLTGFLRGRGIETSQADLGIEMVLKIFSRSGLQAVFEQVREREDELPGEARQMLAVEPAYLHTIEPVIEFLQGRNPSLALLLARPGYLPQGPRFAGHRGRSSSVHALSEQDRAKRFATLYLEDLADLIQATVSPHFSLSRYAEHIARAASSFETIIEAVAVPPTLTDQFMLESLWQHLDRHTPTLVAVTVPFPGNLYGAFRIAHSIKQRRPDITVALGGGYANTELRRLSDPRVFDYVDFVTLDDGERPLLSLIEHLAGTRSRTTLCRTFYREKDRVVFANEMSDREFSMGEVGCPTYSGLNLGRYLTILDSTNPMHRLWSEGHWNKLTVAHGCYWKQCTFCDVGLNYISRYEMTPTDRLIQQIEQLIAETGRRGFHFVDEAAPPAALKALALALLERGITISWWGNIRFEEAFSPDLCRLLAASGCIAVTAGLEAASDRLLEKIKKGITVDQTALVAAAFKDAGILIHAYLMYGCPSETVQETVDSLERVRQLVAADLMQSAFWHRFTATAHSPIGLKPAAHGLRILGPTFQGFAENDLQHEDREGETPDWLGEGLRRSMLNYLEGKGLTLDVRQWFDHATPKPRVSSTWVPRLLKGRVVEDDPGAERRFVWLGGQPVCEPVGRRTRLILPGRMSDRAVTLPTPQAEWLNDLILQSTPHHNPSRPYPLLRDSKPAFPGTAREFDSFLKTTAWKQVRAAGLLLV